MNTLIDVYNCSLFFKNFKHLKRLGDNLLCQMKRYSGNKRAVKSTCKEAVSNFLSLKVRFQNFSCFEAKAEVLSMFSSLCSLGL